MRLESAGDEVPAFSLFWRARSRVQLVARDEIGERR
jgi:hypothetical protein